MKPIAWNFKKRGFICGNNVASTGQPRSLVMRSHSATSEVIAASSSTGHSQSTSWPAPGNKKSLLVHTATPRSAPLARSRHSTIS
jgi:hypothetical protein